MWSSAVMCITMGYLFPVWGGVGVGLLLWLLNDLVAGLVFHLSCVCCPRLVL